MLFSRKRNKPNYVSRAKNRPGAVASARNRPIGKLAVWAASLNWPVVRINAVIGVFCVLWIGLWFRAWQLQMVEGPRLADRARKQHTASELVSGKRGMLFDRNGQVLARSVEVRSIYANPKDVADARAAAKVLAPILRLSEDKLAASLGQDNRKFIWLKRKVDDATAEAVQKASLAGIGLSREYERYYPFKHMAGQLLGFVGMDDKGLEGLERALDSRLGAMPVRQMVQRDAMGRRFYLQDAGLDQPTGEDITLTLDMQVQFMAEEAVAQTAREFGARWSGALVVDVRNGDIIAWAQYPFFNPNTYRQATAQSYRNRLAADALEPGSTFKPLVMAIALQEKKVTPNTLINCEGGKWSSRNFTIRDTSSRGILPASKVLRYSSNIGMAKIGVSLGAPQFYKYLRGLGFGEPVQAPISNSKGIVRKPRDWGEVDVMSAAFGQSVSVTALQMAQAYLTLLNNGVYKPLRLVNEESNVAEVPRRIFSQRTVREVIDMMRDVVEENDGTGKRARVPGVEIAGKTGTAQKADARTGAYGAGRLASFVGFFPANEPRYFILVLVDEPTANPYGGVVAAPAFRDIATRLLTYTGILNDTRVTAKHDNTGKRSRGFKLAQGQINPWNNGSGRQLAQHDDGMQLPGHLARASSLVPDVMGKSVRNAVELFARAGVVPELKGSGNRVVRQSPPPGSPWPPLDKKGDCVLWLSER